MHALFVTSWSGCMSLGVHKEPRKISNIVFQSWPKRILPPNLRIADTDFFFYQINYSIERKYRRSLFDSKLYYYIVKGTKKNKKEEKIDEKLKIFFLKKIFMRLN